ncbi:MAG: response regulator transcription factor [Desulfuromonadales bacterium]|jgi:DNA-binding NarL/FixJ family response regulator
MMNRNTSSKCAECIYRGRHIYVVGPQRFERELVIQCLRAHSAEKWFEADSLRAIPQSNQNVPHGQKMILIDTHTLDREGLLHLFSMHTWKVHSHNLMVLFNLQHVYAIEKIALQNGVRGFLYADDHLEDLCNGICTINSGDLWISRRILQECLQESYIGRSLPQPTDHSLSKREVELLQQLVHGVSNEVIADRLCISPHTVKTHLHNIFHKINVENRIQAVIWAQENL